MLWTDNMVIPKGAENKAPGERFIDWYYEPANAAEIEAWVNYVCPVKGAAGGHRRASTRTLATNPLIFPTPDDDARGCTSSGATTGTTRRALGGRVLAVIGSERSRASTRHADGAARAAIRGAVRTCCSLPGCCTWPLFYVCPASRCSSSRSGRAPCSRATSRPGTSPSTRSVRGVLAEVRAVASRTAGSPRSSRFRWGSRWRTSSRSGAARTRACCCSSSSPRSSRASCCAPSAGRSSSPTTACCSGRSRTSACCRTTSGCWRRPTAVIAGITYNFLPFMTLPAVRGAREDRHAARGGEDLYAGRGAVGRDRRAILGGAIGRSRGSSWGRPWCRPSPAQSWALIGAFLISEAFLRVTFPLRSRRLRRSLLTFIPAVGDFVNAELLGNPQSQMIGNVIQARVPARWPTTRRRRRCRSSSWPRSSSAVLVYARIAGHRGADGAIGLMAPRGRRVRAAASVARAGGGWPRRVDRWLLPLYALLAVLLPRAARAGHDRCSASTTRPGGPTCTWRELLVRRLAESAGPAGAGGRGLQQPPHRARSRRSSRPSSACSSALALVRHAFRGRGATNMLIFLPMSTPEIVLGTSLLTMFIASVQWAFVPEGAALPAEHPDDPHRPRDVQHQLRGRHRQGTAPGVPAPPRGGGDGPRRERVDDVLEGHLPADPARRHRRGAAGIQPVHRRLRHHRVHLRPDRDVPAVHLWLRSSAASRSR